MSELTTWRRGREHDRQPTAPDCERCNRCRARQQAEIERLRQFGGLGFLLGGPHVGADLGHYWVCACNTFLADHLAPQPRPPGDRSPNIATYCRHHRLVPAAPVHGVRILPVARTRWGTKRLHLLLRKTCQQLTLMVRSFKSVRYPSLAEGEGESSETVLLDRVGNEAELIEEIDQVLAETARERATILVFPELTFSEEMLQHLATSLARKPYEDGGPTRDGRS